MSECSFFQLHGGGKIDLGGFARFVAEPKSDDAEVYVAAQQCHGCRMPTRQTGSWRPLPQENWSRGADAAILTEIGSQIPFCCAD